MLTEPTAKDWVFRLLTQLKKYATEPLGYCPECQMLRFIGHTDGCELVLLIEDAEKFLGLDKEEEW